ncbi:MAG TPA: Fis family transcriptional regulator [Myxococcaceae bacterium]|nr:Fis family transcriptional regulator [Myxococcaceae bacterium]
MNRAPVLLSGGAPQDRAGWAQEAAEVGGRPLVTVTRPEQLGSALMVRSAVLFVPDLLTLGDAGQQLLVRTLTSLDERPKLVLGLGRSETSARQAGLLREDLHYRLRMGLLNLDAPGMREAIAARRAEAARRAAMPPPRPSGSARMQSSKTVAGRPPRTKAKARPAQRSRAAPRLKSARTMKPAKKTRPAKKGSKRR